MARHARLMVLLLSLGFCVSATLWALPGAPAAAEPGARAENDAGSGQDAGDAPIDALLIAEARRTWSANLTPQGTDSDWYRLDDAKAFCAVLDVMSNAPGQASLTSDVDRTSAASRETARHGATRLALAGASGGAPFFGLEPATMSLLSASSGGNVPTPSRYSFSLASHSYADLDPHGDGDSPDAGATVATAQALPADCGAGRLTPSAGDAEDRYFFDVSDTRYLTFSLALARGQGATARVVSPTGATYATIGDGDAADVWASEPGRWTLVVSAPAATTPLLPLFGLDAAQEELVIDYLVGVTDGPPGQPCRPSC